MKRSLLMLSIAALITGCQTARVDPDPSILRVGVSPEMRPMIFEQNGQIMGIEADFAYRLGKALNRTVAFIEIPWEKQIDYLEQNKTDIIMSNMTITSPRASRIYFSNPYMQSGLTALFRRENYDPAGLVPSLIRNQSKRIGYIENSSGEFLCKQNLAQATLMGYAKLDKAVNALKKNRIDVLIYDAPILWWIAAVNEREFVAFTEMMNNEPIAWGIGRHNPQLLEQVNDLIAEWEKDGSGEKIIRSWFPGLGQ